MPAEIAASLRPQIEALERGLAGLPQAEIFTDHTFGPGFYARTIVLEPGTVLTGLEHKTEHIFILSEGRIAVADDNGAAELSAPFQCISKPGTKRAGVAITRCVVTNIHITPERDLEKLRLDLVEPMQAIEHAPAVALEV